MCTLNFIFFTVVFEISEGGALRVTARATEVESVENITNLKASQHASVEVPILRFGVIRHGGDECRGIEEKVGGTGKHD